MSPSSLLVVAMLPLLAGSAEAQTSNLGLANEGPIQGFAHGDLVAFTASEHDQGADLDGDGSGYDRVVFVRRVSTGVTTNTALTVPRNDLRPLLLGDRLCLVVVDEPSIGPTGTDRNGDGDATDTVLAAYDAQTGLTYNLGLAVRTSGDLTNIAAVRDDLALFGVAEWLQGADLNGDGDMSDVVLHRWTAGAANAISLGIAMRDSTPALGPRHALFVADELGQGADLDGDGDPVDGVAHALNLATGAITNLGFATRDVRGDGDLFAFSVREPEQGFNDLDGDGVGNDTVMFAYLAPSGVVRNLGRSVSLSSAGGALYDVSGYVIAWLSDEYSASPGHDWNGDGDSTDRVLFTHHARSGVTRDSGLAVHSVGASGTQFEIQDGLVATSVSESFQGGTDLNGDGDAADAVVMFFHAGSGAVVNLGIATAPPTSAFGSSREIFAFVASEASQGSTDLNGDGRIGLVVAIHRFATGATTFLSAVPANSYDLRVAGTNVTWVADENASLPGVDLNGDGDVLDEVLTVWSATTGVEWNVGFAIFHGTSLYRFETSAAAAVFAVDEAAQGVTDLNADGDAVDGIVHVLRF